MIIKTAKVKYGVTLRLYTNIYTAKSQA